MKPVVVVIGRPNVGKSTLFNRLTKSRNAIVVDAPGVTRDRHYGEGRLGERPFLVVDTGGLEPDAKEGIYFEMARQTQQAIAEADAVVWVLDARSGIVAADRTIAEQLRKIDRRVWLAVNKSEGMDPHAATAEFHELALGEPHAIAAAHGDGVRSLLEAVLEPFAQEREPVDSEDAGPRVAIVGRPNVGKSTLVNSLVGENRVIAFDQPGTTRDSIEVPFEIGERKYTLVDTAGLRRRGKQGEAEEHFSVIKALQAIEASNVAVLVLDASTGITDQDAHVAGYILERGRAVVVAVNKWDVADREARERIKHEIGWKLVFLGYAPPLYISARERKGLTELLAGIDRAYASAMAKLSTPKLTRALIAAVERQQPPRRGMGRPKMRYAHQGGMNPPCIVIHGNALDGVPDTYRRYLEGYFRRQFELEGTPLAIEFRTGRNPYAKRG